MKIYTKTGDDGTTGLFSGERVLKSSLRVEAYGTVDELNTILGIIASNNPDNKLVEPVRRIQNLLFNLGSDLATPEHSKMGNKIERIKIDDIEWLEKIIDEFEIELPVLKNFILPGGSAVSAYFHNARTVCRRAERLVVRLSHEETVNDVLIKFINRLSDLFFVMARFANHLSGIEDIKWEK
ncbi:MAG: cob(I)yrinic acid a,c-diamide adenosyltransferase [Ignavibacteriae bacterium]|nr:cob(I)yrinic acid a,c-diamide adenosyltransferase [Ignavibacteriota bacterium]